MAKAAVVRRPRARGVRPDGAGRLWAQGLAVRRLRRESRSHESYSRLRRRPADRRAGRRPDCRPDRASPRLEPDARPEQRAACQHHRSIRAERRRAGDPARAGRHRRRDRNSASRRRSASGRRRNDAPTGCAPTRRRRRAALRSADGDYLRAKGEHAAARRRSACSRTRRRHDPVSPGRRRAGSRRARCCARARRTQPGRHCGPAVPGRPAGRLSDHQRPTGAGFQHLGDPPRRAGLRDDLCRPGLAVSDL